MDEKQIGSSADFFFYPLWEMSSSTLPWQFSNGGRLDTTKCDIKKKKHDSDHLFLQNMSVTICSVTAFAVKINLILLMYYNRAPLNLLGK